MSSKLPWPESVWVAVPQYFVFDGPPGCDIANQPQSMTSWLDWEIRTSLIEKQGVINIHTFSIMYDLWMKKWHSIFPTYFHNLPPSRLTRRQREATPPFPSRNIGTVNLKSFPGFSRYDLYNATWASLGYVNNQSPKALQLLSLSSR